MVNRWLIIFIFTLYSNLLLSQDERAFKELFKDLTNKVEIVPEVKFNFSGSHYRLDLNQDKIEEAIIPQKRDGVDWIEIQNSSGGKIFETKLPASGAFSSIYKIKFVTLSSVVKALIIFLDEGITSGRKFESVGRIFVLSFENNDLSKVKFFQGPHFYHEKEKIRDHYWRRSFSVNIYDIDEDGIREIVVQYNRIQRILKYNQSGEWQRL